MTILDLIAISRPAKRRPLTEAEREAVRKRLQNARSTRKNAFLARENEGMAGEARVEPVADDQGQENG